MAWHYVCYCNFHVDMWIASAIHHSNRPTIKSFQPASRHSSSPYSICLYFQPSSDKKQVKHTFQSATNLPKASPNIGSFRRGRDESLTHHSPLSNLARDAINHAKVSDVRADVNRPSSSSILTLFLNREKKYKANWKHPRKQEVDNSYPFTRNFVWIAGVGDSCQGDRRVDRVLL